MAETAIVHSNVFLAALPDADRAALASDMKDVTLDQGMVLREQGFPEQYVYFPHSGMVSLMAIMQDGHAVEAATLGSDGAVGVMAGFGDWQATNRAIVQIAGSATRVSASQFLKTAANSPALKRMILLYKNMLFSQVQQTAACNALHDAEQRLARWLLQAADYGRNAIPLTQEYLSEMLGVRRTTITQIAGELQNRNLIRYRRGQIEIVDRTGLSDLSCECYETIRRIRAEFLSRLDAQPARV